MIGLVSEWKTNIKVKFKIDLFLLLRKGQVFFFFIIESNDPNKSREIASQCTLRDVKFSLYESRKATDTLRRWCMVNLCFASMATIYGEQIEIFYFRLIMSRLLIT